MQLSFMPAALRRWDELLTEPADIGSLVLSFFSDERPLRGVAGLADWRLCGQLSRLIVAGHLTGEKGESLMMPASRRLPFDRIFLFGLGSGERMDESRFTEHAKWMCDVLKRAGAVDYAIQVPGRATGLIGAQRAGQLWQAEALAHSERVTLIDSQGAHKELGDLLVG